VEHSRKRHSYQVRGDGHPVNPHLDVEKNCRTASFIHVAPASHSAYRLQANHRHKCLHQPRPTLPNDGKAPSRDGISRRMSPRGGQERAMKTCRVGGFQGIWQRPQEKTTSSGFRRRPAAAARHPPTMGSRMQIWSTRRRLISLGRGRQRAAQTDVEAQWQSQGTLP
jgi:hypothetical protein